MSVKKPFSTLREKMSPEAKALSAARAEQLRDGMFRVDAVREWVSQGLHGRIGGD